MAWEKEQQGVNGVEIGIKIAHALARLPGRSHLREIAEAAALPASKTHRYLVSLCRAGLVEQDREDGRYDLAAGAITLGLAAQNRIDGFRLVDDVMNRIYEQVRLTVSVFAWGNHGPTVIRRIDAAGPIILTTRIGSVIPVINTAAGQLFAAHLPSDLVDVTVEDELKRGITSAATGKAITRKMLDRTLDDVRKKGFSHVSGGFIAGSDAVSAPVFDATGQMIMAISLIFAPGTKLQQPNPAALLLGNCQLFSRRLGFNGPMPGEG